MAPYLQTMPPTIRIILILLFIAPIYRCQTPDYESSDYAENSEDYGEGPSEETNCGPSSDSIYGRLQKIHQHNRNLDMVKHVLNLNETMRVIDHLVNLTASLLKAEISQQQLLSVAEFFYEINVTDHCFLSLTQVLRGISNKQIWAFKFVDAIGKIPTGIAEGSISHFGEFDECLEIEEPVTTGSITGQYCLAKLILPYPDLQSYHPGLPLYGRHHYQYLLSFLRLYNLDNYLTERKFIELLNNQRGATLRLGICFPSPCSPNEIEDLLNQILYPVLKMPVELQPDCYSKQTDSARSFDSFELASIIIIAVVLLVNLVFTVSHLILIRKPKLVHSSHRWLTSLLECFSMIRNTEALFDLKATDPCRLPTTARRFLCVDVIRLILVINVCIDHMFLFTPFMSFMAFKRILNSVITKVYYYNKYFFARNILIIDALFIISGLLLSYSLLRKLSLNQGKMHYSLFVIRLWLKYSVPMFGVVLLFWILPLFGDGPIWKIGMALLVNSCKERDSLLSSFTYLSNYRIKASQNVFNFDSQFAVLQVLGPFFIMIIYRNAKYGLAVNILLVLVGCYASISPHHLFGQKTYLDGLNISSLEEMTKAFVAFHMGINQYVISFFIGIITGYLVNYQLVYQRFSMNRYVEVILWLVSLVALSAVMFWFNTLHRINQVPSRLSVLLWFSLGKLVACLAIAWMLYALCVGQAVIIEQVFSLSLFRYLSRLSFGIYLLHFIPLTYRLFSVRDTYVMTDKILFEFILIDFIQTSFMASIFYITVERPFNNLTAFLCDMIIRYKSPTNGNVKSLEMSSQGSTVLSGDTPSTHTPTTSDIINIKSSLPNVNLFAANCHDVYFNATVTTTS